MTAVGQTLAPFVMDPVDPEAMKVWAVALHDPNPIHLDRAAVAAKGLGDRRINQGPANLAYVINMLQAAFPGAAIRSLDVRYIGNVFEDDAVTATGVVSAVEGHAVTCDVWLEAARRGKVITGTAVIVETP